MKHASILIFFGCFLCANSLIANELASFFSSDSVPKNEKIYRGYRLSLIHFRVENVSKKAISVRCDAVNTGRLPLDFSDKKIAPFDLVIEMDTTEWPISLNNYQDLIEMAVAKAKINLTPGKIQKDLFLKLTLPEKTNPTSTKMEPKMVDKVDKTDKTAVQTVVLPDKSTKIDIKKTTKTAESAPYPIEKPAVLEKKVGESTLKEALPDLIVDSIWVVKMTKKYVQMAFIVKNVGEGTARLGGVSNKKDDDNLALNVYFSSSKKLSRGAMLADGIFISEKTAENGLLLPTERFYAEMKVPLENKTRFTQMIIFELDPFQTVTESNKTNNTKSIQLVEK
jgi:hypothetical protein